MKNSSFLVFQFKLLNDGIFCFFNNMQVIEYIQFLQEKVHKYEGPYQGWNNEQTKLIPWVNPLLGFS